MIKANIFVLIKTLEDVLEASSEDEDERRLHQDEYLLAVSKNFMKNLFPYGVV